MCATPPALHAPPRPFHLAALLLTVCLAAAPLAGCSGQSAGRAGSFQSTAASVASTFSFAQIPAYTGSPYTIVNDNAPTFTEADLDAPAEAYAPLDDLGRCGAAMAIVSRDTMPTKERGSIGMIKPTGWHTVRYDDLIDDKYLYNRCHLIGRQLTGEDANERNLITGTRYLNVEGMLSFENEVADYVNRTGNRVLYCATPVFVGDELVARGVHIEALSVEDDGAGVSFNVFCYNVQPGVGIDYATGDSWRDESVEDTASGEERISGAESPSGAESSPTGASTGVLDDATALPGNATAGEDSSASSSKTGSATSSGEASSEENDERTYILNTNTGVFHLPSCRSVSQMSERNKREMTAPRASVIEQGYHPCANCNP